MSLPPNTFFLLFSSFPLGFQPGLCISPLVWSLNPSFFMHFTHLNLGFGFSWNFLGFLKIDEYFVKFLGWVLCFWCYIIMHFHFISIFTMFHAFRCVFICWKLCVNRFGLGWTHDAFLLTHHMFMHFSCIRTLSFLSILCWVVMLCFLFLSLSLSHRLCMAPKHKFSLSKPFSFRDIFLWSYSSLHSVPWWEGL